MSIESNSHSSQSRSQQPASEDKWQPDEFESIAGTNELPNGLSAQQVNSAIASVQSQQNTTALQQARSTFPENSSTELQVTPRALLITLFTTLVTVVGIVINQPIVGIVGTVSTLLLSAIILFPWLQVVVTELLTPQQRALIIAFLGITVAIAGLVKFVPGTIDWDISGTLADWFGALGQILIAIIAVYVAWRQYVISKDLTIQQNLLTIQQNNITQQQTIDTYFQGISDLVLDEEGLLEDWPQERLLAEGRTASILSSVDAVGKAKILRFLSRSKLLTPLQRDAHLGRAILDGSGGYAEDLVAGVRVIDLGVMLAGANLSGTDLRWTDLSEANLVRVNLNNCDLVKSNLCRAILYEANLSGADLNGTKLFYGSLETASPRSRLHPPNYRTGERTGAVVEKANFTNIKRISQANRHYCCSWCGEESRKTIPGGCEGIENKLGR
ncbi:putative low-complexity protein [Rivularia sp. PCC 7116]|uniref:pentapeptide repeat-containing protein n=1 Tax=Rivularia sp. PCC 7116 TaxID=373994 RepID=UPI00029EE4AE|nr:pentapeptide repeat-containing protein [Rivularia sp. PCC 7116]AFY55887.1 putative low-complexity protein [Rivularia sp. PCC 7116]